VPPAVLVLAAVLVIGLVGWLVWQLAKHILAELNRHLDE
jgi:hypothetical protein